MAVSAFRVSSSTVGLLRRIGGLLLLAALLLPLWAFAGAQAQGPLDNKTIRDRLEGQRAVADSVEAGLGRDELRSQDLDELRSRIDPVRSDLTAAIAILEPQLGDLNHRLEEIGPKPAADAPAENPSVTAERDDLTARVAELDALTKQVRLLRSRGDQLADRITSRRRALFTDTLLARSYSILDPDLWISATSAVPVELRGLNYLAGDWRAYVNSRLSGWEQFALLCGAGGIIFVAGLLRRLLNRPLRRFRDVHDGGELTRLQASSASVLVGLVAILPSIGAALGVLALLSGFDAVPPRVLDIAQGVLTAVMVVAIGRGLLLAALAPDEPNRRVVPLSDFVVKLLDRHLNFGIWLLAIVAVINNIHRSLVMPVPLTVATSAVLSLLLALLGIYTIRQLVAASPEEEDIEIADAAALAPSARAVLVMQWSRFPFWITSLTVLAALLAGYVAFAAYLSTRVFVGVMFALGVYLLVALINAFLVDGVAEHHRARSVARTLGLRPASLELVAVLFAGLLKVTVVLVAIVLVVGTWGNSAADLRDTVGRVTFGFTIGNSSISLGDIFYALLFLVVGIVVARAIQRWFSTSILPRTTLDTGLQNSIATIIGYVLSIGVIASTMGQIGLNLQSFALVAGALSVGIGFGLQSIVSNFVSGLILLAERPIRVGDTINVKGEEGYVRRISVRATEIETFDRAAVLIPNSDLITGVVKNYTHANTTGRVIVKVNVAYDADADEVRDLLVGCACDHPQVLRSPPPRVFLMAFGDSYLQFELRCVVANVDYALTVKSDLHFAVLDRLRKARIGIPYTAWNIYWGDSLNPQKNPAMSQRAPDADG